MQIVGRACEVCARPVSVQRDAEGCAACDLVYHSGCLRAAGTCDACGASTAGFEDADTPEELATHERHARDVGIGRFFLLGAGGINVAMIALYAALLLPASGTSDEAMKLPAILATMLSGALLYYAYRGSQWARLTLGALVFVSGCGLVWIGQRSIAVSAIGALRVVTGAVLLFAGAVREFVASQRLRR